MNNFENLLVCNYIAKLDVERRKSERRFVNKIMKQAYDILYNKKNRYEEVEL